MTPRLKLHGEIVWNLADLRREFDPVALYEQRELFARFAAVHCLALPLRLKDGEMRSDADRLLNRAFWQKVLEHTGEAGTATRRIPREVLRDLEAVALRTYLKLKPEDALERAVGLQNARELLKEELTLDHIGEKLDFIAASLQSGKKPAEGHRVVALLAICQLCEMDARKLSFRREEGREPQSFLYEGQASLETGAVPYRFWYHDEDALAEREELSVVRVEAKAGAQGAEAVTLEAVSKRSGKTALTLILRRGEFRYCTVAGGRIVRVLPAVSLSDDLCLSRQYDREELTVEPRQGESWTLEVQGVSSFAAGGREAGFLLVRDGKVNTGFLKGAGDFMTKLRLEMVPEPVVEARMTGRDYELLTCRGNVVASTSADGKTGVLTLTDRTPPTVEGRPQAEGALSPSGKSAAVLEGRGRKRRTLFLGLGAGFELPDGGRIIRLKEGK